MRWDHWTFCCKYIILHACTKHKKAKENKIKLWVRIMTKLLSPLTILPHPISIWVEEQSSWNDHGKNEEIGWDFSNNFWPFCDLKMINRHWLKFGEEWNWKDWNLSKRDFGKRLYGNCLPKRNSRKIHVCVTCFYATSLTSQKWIIEICLKSVQKQFHR